MERIRRWAKAGYTMATLSEDIEYILDGREAIGLERDYALRIMLATHRSDGEGTMSNHSEPLSPIARQAVGLDGYCKKRVFTGARWDIGGHPCPRKAKPGSPFCAQHQPEAEEARREASIQRYRNERQAEEQRHKDHDAAIRADERRRLREGAVDRVAKIIFAFPRFDGERDAADELAGQLLDAIFGLEPSEERKQRLRCRGCGKDIVPSAIRKDQDGMDCHMDWAVNALCGPVDRV